MGSPGAQKPPTSYTHLPVPGCLLDNSLVLKSAQCCLLLVAISLHSAGDGILLPTFLHKNHTKLSVIILVSSKRLHRIALSILQK